MIKIIESHNIINIQNIKLGDLYSLSLCEVYKTKDLKMKWQIIFILGTLVLPLVSAQLGICDGFIFNGTCYTIGSEIVSEGGVYSYIDINGDLQPQKEDGAECQNNFECLNNLCSFGECVNLYKEIEGRRSIIEEIEGTDPYANDTNGNATNITIGSTSFSINVKVCKSLPCTKDDDVFYKDENIYVDYSVTLENVTVKANLKDPDGNIEEIDLSKPLKASRLGIYELELRGSKEGYTPVTRKKIFGVVNQPVQIMNPACNLDGICDRGENTRNCPEDCPGIDIVEDVIKDPFWLTVIIVVLVIAILIVIALILKERVKKHGTRITPAGPIRPRAPPKPFRPTSGLTTLPRFRPRPRPRPRLIPR